MENSTWKIYPHVLKNCRCFGRDFYRRVFGWWHFLRYQSNNEKQCFRNVTKKGSMSPATSTFIKNPLKKLPEALEAKLQPHDGSLTHLLQAIKLEGLHLWFVFFGGNRGPRFSSFSTGQPHWGNPTPPPPKWSKQVFGWWIIWWNWSDDVISKGILLGEFGLVSEKVTASNSVIHPELL